MQNTGYQEVKLKLTLSLGGGENNVLTSKSFFQI